MDNKLYRDIENSSDVGYEIYKKFHDDPRVKSVFSGGIGTDICSADIVLKNGKHFILDIKEWK